MIITLIFRYLEKTKTCMFTYIIVRGTSRHGVLTVNLSHVWRSRFDRCRTQWEQNIGNECSVTETNSFHTTTIVWSNLSSITLFSHRWLGFITNTLSHALEPIILTHSFGKCDGVRGFYSQYSLIFLLAQESNLFYGFQQPYLTMYNSTSNHWRGKESTPARGCYFNPVATLTHNIPFCWVVFWQILLRGGFI